MYCRLLSMWDKTLYFIFYFEEYLIQIYGGVGGGESDTVGFLASADCGFLCR